MVKSFKNCAVGVLMVIVLATTFGCSEPEPTYPPEVIPNIPPGRQAEGESGMPSAPK